MLPFATLMQRAADFTTPYLWEVGVKRRINVSLPLFSVSMKVKNNPTGYKYSRSHGKGACMSKWTTLADVKWVLSVLTHQPPRSYSQGKTKDPLKHSGGQEYEFLWKVVCCSFLAPPHGERGWECFPPTISLMTETSMSTVGAVSTLPRAPKLAI